MTQITAGMDVEAGLRTSQQLAHGADQLRAIATSVTGALAQSPWQGNDALRMRAYWHSTGQKSLTTASEGLRDAAERLRHEVDQQRQASEGSTGVGAAASAATAAQFGGGGAPTQGPEGPPGHDDDPVPPGYDQALHRLSPEEQAKVTAALDGESDPDARTLIRNAVAKGLNGSTLGHYLDRVAVMSDSQVDALLPQNFTNAGLSQPDQTTCGSSSLVMARMINRPDYAMQVIDGYDPGTGKTVPGDTASRFRDESLAMHDRTNGFTDRDGDFNGWWPKSLGTSPGSVAREMSSEGGSGVPGSSYEVDYQMGESRDSSFDKIDQAARAGHVVPIYSGDGWAPRHVLLVTGSDANGITVYDPGSGRTQTVSRQQWGSDNVGLGGWQQPWAAVLPDPLPAGSGGGSW